MHQLLPKAVGLSIPPHQTTETGRPSLFSTPHLLTPPTYLVDNSPLLFTFTSALPRESATFPPFERPPFYDLLSEFSPPISQICSYLKFFLVLIWRSPSPFDPPYCGFSPPHYVTFYSTVLASHRQRISLFSLT